MNEKKIKAAGNSNKIADDSFDYIKDGKPEPGGNGKAGRNPALYYLLSAVLAILKLLAVLTLIFAFQNLSDIIRLIPFTSSLQPAGALIFSYIIIQIMCSFLYMVYLGSVRRFFIEIFPTVSHFTGFIVYFFVVPALFSLAAGGLWWAIARIDIAGTLSMPFLWIPQLIMTAFKKSGSMPVFIGLTLLLPVISLVPVLLIDRPLRKMKVSMKLR